MTTSTRRIKEGRLVVKGDGEVFLQQTKTEEYFYESGDSPDGRRASTTCRGRREVVIKEEPASSRILEVHRKWIQETKEERRKKKEEENKKREEVEKYESGLRSAKEERKHLLGEEMYERVTEVLGYENMCNGGYPDEGERAKIPNFEEMERIYLSVEDEED